MRRRRWVRPGFTLIELLIVVAIIGILAAIAIPNLRNAQLRAKVAKIHGNFQAIGTALHAYRVDNTQFPNNGRGHLIPDNLYVLTTPIAYISSVREFRDPFVNKRTNPFRHPGNQDALLYFSYNRGNLLEVGDTWAEQITPILNKQPNCNFWDGWCMASWGPDPLQDSSVPEWTPVLLARGDIAGALAQLYDPSNGLISPGGIGRYGGSVPRVQTIVGAR